MAPPFLPAAHPSIAASRPHIASGPGGTGWSSIIGIIVAIIGNILISFALNTQRYAHIKLSREKEEAEDKAQSDKDRRSQSYGSPQNGESRSYDKHQDSHAQGERQPLLQRSASSSSVESGDSSTSVKSKNYLSSPWWWLGISLMTIGECGNFLAYGFAPASIVSPLGVVALVSNCLIAPWMLQEKFRMRDALGVLIATAGCVIVVLSASGSNPKLDADEIWRLITTWEFETYLGITIGLIVVLMWASSRYGDKSILIDLGLVGLFGGYTALSTKGVASLLSNTIWRVITFPITYLLVAVLVSTAIMQIKYVNRALQRFNSTQVIPTQFVMFTISVILGSAVLYRDFERKSAEDALEFFGGCALTFLGVWCITSGRPKDGDEDDGNSSDEDEGIHMVAEDGAMDTPRRSDFVRKRTWSMPGAVHDAQARPETPLVRITTTDNEEIPENMLSSQTLMPGASSAVHDDLRSIDDSRASPKRKSRKPPMHATTSDPVLPRALLEPIQTSDLQRMTKADHKRSQSQGRPRTPDTQLRPTSPPRHHTPRMNSISRPSFTDMLPTMGPLTNPLSNSLSAIVADSIRKGVDVPPGGSVRRHSLRSRPSRRFDSSMTVTPLVPEEEGVQSDQQTPGGAQHQRRETEDSLNTPTGTSDLEGRSFGHAFGQYMRRKKSKSRFVEDGM